MSNKVIRILNNEKMLIELMKLINDNVHGDHVLEALKLVKSDDKYIEIDYADYIYGLNRSKGHLLPVGETPKLWDERFEKTNEELWIDAARRLGIEGYSAI
jgi:hypothetical protein